ncbi:MAG: hypothetical protein IIC67_11075 [Thaumarchaeota archaeon]|nr:hypothetical protein [Nitrososphaerota archaeon]
MMLQSSDIETDKARLEELILETGAFQYSPEKPFQLASGRVSPYYFDLKKGIKHDKGSILTIPDGYLLRFSQNPSLTIIENELSTHDVVTHIGVQFIKFNSALTDTSKYRVKKFLTDYLKENPKEENQVKQLLSLTHWALWELLIEYELLLELLN